MIRRFKIRYAIPLLVGLGLGALVVTMTDNQDLYYAFAGIGLIFIFVGARMGSKISTAKLLRNYLPIAPFVLVVLIGYIFDNSWSGWVMLILLAVGTIIAVVDIWKGMKRVKKQSDP